MFSREDLLEDGISGKIQKWHQSSKALLEKQKTNPFANWDTLKKQPPRLSKDDERYGKPVEGSLTEFRGKKADKHVSKEIVDLCDVIDNYGTKLENGHIVIPFGELFQIYTKVSTKLVGILIRARRHGYVEFKGEILYQRQDEAVPVYLLRYPEGATPVRLLFDAHHHRYGSRRHEVRGDAASDQTSILSEQASSVSASEQALASNGSEHALASSISQQAMHAEGSAVPCSASEPALSTFASEKDNQSTGSTDSPEQAPATFY